MKRENRKMLKNLLTNFLSATQKSQKIFCDISTLTGRQQRVIIEGICSNWKNVKAGVPQGSILIFTQIFPAPRWGSGNITVFRTNIDFLR
jgi:hypothetical protein